MQHSFSIYSDGIKLVPLSLGNIENLRVLRNSKRGCFISKEYISEEQQFLWFESYLRKENDYMFEVLDGTDAFLGAISLYDVDMQSKKAEFGRLVICDDAPKYTGTKSIMGILRFAKETLMLEKIVCSVNADNTRAISLYRRIGFTMYKESSDLLFYEYVLN